MNDTYESGPFCVHYGEPGLCDAPCATCGHACDQHIFGRMECQYPSCDCQACVDADNIFADKPKRP